MIEEPEAHETGDSAVNLLSGRSLNRLTVLQTVFVNDSVRKAVGSNGVRFKCDLVPGESRLECVNRGVETPVSLRNGFQISLPHSWGSKQEVSKLQRLIGVVAYLEDI